MITGDEGRFANRPYGKRKSVGRLIGVFNEDKTMNENLVWYVAYGSNILRERFLVYINGGSFRGSGKSYTGCTCKTPPIKDKPFTVPYELYFGNSSRSWGGKGVAFIDPNKESVTRGRAYLITLAQFEEIQKQEGSSPNWYGRTVQMGCDENKIPYRTFTSKIRHPDNAPSDEYLAVIEEGLQELAVVHPNYREG